jgi:peptidoglycan hydrolase-like protein with peptidoglycan-binding domain
MAVSASGAALARDNQASAETDKAELAVPLQMLVSLKEQQINVYRGTDLVRTAPISSGKRGNSTPPGVFSILEKRRRHFSNLYNNAPMPYMQRLTWSGVALHQGKLPGYPASHGCIRLPRNFAKDLYGMTERGMHVVVTRDAAVPELIEHDVLPQPFREGTSVASLSSGTIAADPALRGSVSVVNFDPKLTEKAEANPHFDQPLRMIVTLRKPENERKALQRLLNEMGFNAGPVDGVVGRKTRAAIELFQESHDLLITGKMTDGLMQKVYKASGHDKDGNAILRVRRKFRDIYQAPVTLTDPTAEIGTHVFTALAFKPGDAKVDWMAVPAEGESHEDSGKVLNRLVISDTVRREISKILTPGSSLIVTDRSFARNTGLGTDFVVVTR